MQPPTDNILRKRVGSVMLGEDGRSYIVQKIDGVKSWILHPDHRYWKIIYQSISMTEEYVVYVQEHYGMTSSVIGEIGANIADYTKRPSWMLDYLPTDGVVFWETLNRYK